MFDVGDHQMFGKGPPNVQSTTLMSKIKIKKKKKKKSTVVVYQMFKEELPKIC
jgi:hypothetical protein